MIQILIYNLMGGQAVCWKPEGSIGLLYVHNSFIRASNLQWINNSLICVNNFVIKTVKYMWNDPVQNKSHSCFRSFYPHVPVYRCDFCSMHTKHIQILQVATLRYNIPIFHESTPNIFFLIHITTKEIYFRINYILRPIYILAVKFFLQENRKHFDLISYNNYVFQNISFILCSFNLGDHKILTI